MDACYRSWEGRIPKKTLCYGAKAFIIKQSAHAFHSTSTIIDICRNDVWNVPQMHEKLDTIAIVFQNMLNYDRKLNR